jgi:FixJ family two-component response regulator
MSGPVVHVVDDDETMRVALARVLRGEGHEVRTYSSAGEFLLAPLASTPGCIVLDLSMPGPSGLDLQEALARHAIALPVVFVTGYGDVASSVRAMKAGAVDFLTKPVEPATLANAVATALRRDHTARERQREIDAARARHRGLSPREREVFDQVVAGRLNKQIADALGISERTVKMHRASVMTKMSVRSLAELVQAAALIGRTGAADGRAATDA